MAHRPTQGTDSAKPSGRQQARPENFAKTSDLDGFLPNGPPPAITKPSDFAQIAAKFAAHGAGKIPAKLSGELALDLILNEIVEQACLATGASGAAIALRRDDIIVCRATCGANAPELGARLENGSGLSGACVRSGAVQSCDDAWNDGRANADLSRQLGVRSIVVYPLARGNELLGILEILSPLPSAFGTRDLQTLEILASRIIKNAEAASQTSFESAVAALPGPENREETMGQKKTNEPDIRAPLSNPVPAETSPVRSSLLEAPVDYVIPNQQTHFDWMTATLGATILAIAFVMGAAFSMRIGWIKINGRRDSHRLETVSPGKSGAGQTGTNPANVSPATTPAEILPGRASAIAAKSSSGTATAGEKREGAPVGEGSLFVYQGEKEIFRMSPSAAKSAAAAKPELISRIEPEYPAQALARHIQGRVSLHVRVSADGRVQEIKVASGDPLLAEAAVAAVRQWRFRPYILNGQSTKTETDVTLRFTLPAN